MSDDYTADLQTTGTVAVGGTATGEIETAGDQDWFAVELEAGVEYRIDLEGSATGGGTLVDPWLRWLHDADRAGIRGTRDLDGGEGLNARQVFTPTESGIYYISANGAQGQTGSYTLSVTRLTPPAGGTTETLPGPSDTDDPDDGAPPDGTEDGSPPDPPIAPEPTAADLPADTTTTGVVAVGGSVTSEIETVGDLDWFAVELEAGVEYRIDLKGSPTDDGTLLNPVLYGVRTAAGADVAGTFDDNGGEGRNAQERFTATESGVHYIMAGSNHTTGSYLLSVTRTTPAPAQDDPDEVTEDGPSPGPPIAPEPELSVADAEAREGEDAVLRFRVTLDRAAAVAVTVGYATVDGTAVAGEDYEAASGTLTFAPGETELSVEVAVIDDTVEDSGETFTLRLSDPSGAALADAEAIGTIVNSEPADDYSADTTTTGTVAVSGSATGVIDYTGDPDWFAVELEAGRTYRIDLEGLPTGGGTLFDPYLGGVHDADGVLLAGTTNDAGGAGRNARVTFTAQKEGTYYVAAGADGDGEGTYTLSVTDVTDGIPDDFAAGVGTTGTVAVGSSVTGDVETSGDRDWFAVSLEAGRTYRIDLEGSPTGGGTLFDPYLGGVHDADGVLLAGTTNDDDGAVYNSRVVFSVEEDGTYYVAAGAKGDREGTYTLSVTDFTDRDDFAAGTGTSGTVAIGSPVTGEIDFARDRDWFAVTLEAGKAYWFELEGSQTTAGTLVEPYLRGVYDADGILLTGTTNDDPGAGYNGRVVFSVDEDGTYYVAAGAWRNGQGTYTLSVTDVTDGFPGDLAAGPGTSGTVAVGSSVTGEIDYAGDRDWFAVTLEAGNIYRIDLEGWWGLDRGGTLFDTYLRGVHDADGVLLDGTTNDDGGTAWNSRVTFTAEEDGTHYVAAGADGNWAGTYTLSVTDVTVDLAAGTGTSGTVEVGGSATGEIDYAGDRDWFAVTLEAGRTYRIDLEGPMTGGGTLRDPYLHGVHDADGVLLDGTTNDDDGAGRSSRVTFTAEYDGTYYVLAGAEYDGEGTYTLSVTDVTDGVPDDFAAGIGTAGTVAVGGSVMGEIDFRDDRDWFAVTLEAGKTYRIDLEGWETGLCTLRDPYLRGVHDADGVLLDGTTNDDGDAAGWNSRVTFTAEEDGTYYVAAGAWGDREGIYTLSVEEVM